MKILKAMLAVFSFVFVLGFMGCSPSDAGTDSENVPNEGVVAEDTPELVNIAVIGKGQRLYFEGQKFDTSGLEVFAIYSDGKKSSVEFEVSPEILSVKDETITISYGNKSVELPVVVKQIRPVGIVFSGEYKTVYIEGEDFDSTGLIVEVHYNDGSVKPVENFLIEGSVLDQVIVKYSEELSDGSIVTIRDSVSVIVNARKALVNIEVVSGPAKTEYFPGEEFDPSGLEIIANYTTGNEVVASNELSFDKVLLSKDDTSVTVSYTFENITRTEEIEVSVVSVSDIEVESYKSTYYNNESFDKSSLALNAVYSNGNIVNIEPDDIEVELKPFTANDKSIVISVTVLGETLSKTLDVTIVYFKEIKVENYKSDYTVGDIFNSETLEAYAVLSDDTEVLLDNVSYDTDPLCASDTNITLSTTHLNETQSITLDIFVSETPEAVINLAYRLFGSNFDTLPENLALANLSLNTAASILYSIESSTFTTSKTDAFTMFNVIIKTADETLLSDNAFLISLYPLYLYSCTDEILSAYITHFNGIHSEASSKLQQLNTENSALNVELEELGLEQEQLMLEIQETQNHPDFSACEIVYNTVVAAFNDIAQARLDLWTEYGIRLTEEEIHNYYNEYVGFTDQLSHLNDELSATEGLITQTITSIRALALQKLTQVSIQEYATSVITSLQSHTHPTLFASLILSGDFLIVHSIVFPWTY